LVQQQRNRLAKSSAKYGLAPSEEMFAQGLRNEFSNIGEIQRKSIPAPDSLVTHESGICFFL
jgi:hypothetical protein